MKTYAAEHGEMKQELLEMCCYKAHEIREVFEANPDYKQYNGRIPSELFKTLMVNDEIGISNLNACYLVTRYIKQY